MAARLAIRRATLQDYQGVMDIGKIYQGRDYLPAMYDKYLNGFNCYVGEIEGEIVSFHSDRLVDAGAAIAIAGGRVKERYRGCGIIADVLRYVDNSYKDVTSVKYMTMTTDNLNIKLSGERIKRKFTQILEMKRLKMIGNVQDLKPNEFDETNVQELTLGDLKEIFQSKVMCSKLFPGERILLSGYPFRLLPQNIPLMMDGFTFWGTKSSDQSTYKTLTVTENYYLGTGLMFSLGIYGNDAIGIQQRALKHIQNPNRLVRNGTCTSTIIHIIHPLDCLDTSFLSVFRKFGLEINNEFAINRYILLERKMR